MSKFLFCIVLYQKYLINGVRYVCKGISYCCWMLNWNIKVTIWLNHIQNKSYCPFFFFSKRTINNGIYLDMLKICTVPTIQSFSIGQCLLAVNYLKGTLHSLGTSCSIILNKWASYFWISYLNMNNFKLFNLILFFA